MPKKPTVQTVAATVKALRKAAPTFSSQEEQALRMKTGVGLEPHEKLGRKVTNVEGVAEKLARIELEAFRAMGQKIYGIGGARSAASPSAGRSPKEKIIRSLKK